MKMHKGKIVRAIRQFASAVRELNEAELDSFLLELESASQSKRLESKRELTTLPKIKTEPLDVHRVTSRITASASRDEGAAFLAELRLPRRELVVIARRSDVHVTKEDTVGDIELKLVEALIGSRLNSRAIRGDS